MIAMLLVLILVAYLTAISCYLMLLTISAMFFSRKSLEGAPLKKIAIVIPAHNEEGQIPCLIRGLEGLNYPQAHYTIYLIADNCSDRTAELAREGGIQVFERTDPNKRGKGAALDWFFNRHYAVYEAYDVVALIDADTTPHPNFLQEISKAFHSPRVQAVQGYYTVLNPNDNWMTALSQAALSLVHHLRPSGRNYIGSTAGLKGNGMAFSSALLQKHGWPCNSLVEDMEFSLYLLERGILVYYYPEAIVYGEMPIKTSQAEVQRKRWEEGRWRLIKHRWRDLLVLFFKRRKFYFLESFFDLITAPLSVLLLCNLLLFFISQQMQNLFLSTWLLINLTYLVLYAMGGLILCKAPKYVWIAFLATPFFVIFKLSLYLKMLLQKRPMRWIRTKRSRELYTKHDS